MDAFRIFAIQASIFIFILLPVHGIAQQNFYDTDLLTSDFHKQRREILRSKLPPSSVAIFFANPVRNRSNDVDYMYSQDPDFYYFSGLTEPDAVLLIFSEAADLFGSQSNEALFVRERNKDHELWNGPILGIESAITHLGVDHVYENRKYLEAGEVIGNVENILIKYPKDIDLTISKRSSLNRMVSETNDWLMDRRKSASTKMLTSLLEEIREVKTKEELALLSKAIDMTCEGIEEVMKKIEPGMTEYQAQAIAEFHYRYSGSEYQGYGSICGSGNNTCTLHYITNRKIMDSGELFLIDIGAEYHGYTADVTRTIPVNGKFTPEQKQIYDLVLEAQLAGIRECMPGKSFLAPGNVCKKIIDNGLQKLGITDEPGEYIKYFMHGTSHYLGLEVHDPGTNGPLKPGNVITVEPGIYIPIGSSCDKKWWGIGVRIEDDVLITEGEPDVLSGHLAKSTESIENLMNTDRAK